MSMLMIGAPTRRRLAKGEVREAKFYYVGANPFDVAPKVGEAVDWCPSYQSADLTQSSVGSEVSEVRADWVGGSQPDTEGNGTSTTAWMIYVSAKCGEEDDGSGGGTTNTPENLEKRVKKSYTLKEVYLDPIWWGVLKADKKTAGVEPWKTIKDTKNKKEFEYYHWLLNAKGDDCKEGDYYFKSANMLGLKVREIDTSGTSPNFGTITEHTDPAHANGTTDISLSPYGDATGPSKGPTDDNIESAGTKCKVVVYLVTYYEKAKEYDGFLDWTGLSPSGDSAFSTKCKPNYGLNEEHFWKAIDVRVNKVKDTNSDTWIEITRQCEAAPFLPSDQWKWNADKAVWGEWTW